MPDSRFVKGDVIWFVPGKNVLGIIELRSFLILPIRFVRALSPDPRIEGAGNLDFEFFLLHTCNREPTRAHEQMNFGTSAVQAALKDICMDPGSPSHRSTRLTVRTRKLPRVSPVDTRTRRTVNSCLQHAFSVRNIVTWMLMGIRGFSCKNDFGYDCLESRWTDYCKISLGDVYTGEGCTESITGKPCVEGEKLWLCMRYAGERVLIQHFLVEGKHARYACLIFWNPPSGWTNHPWSSLIFTKISRTWKYRMHIVCPCDGAHAVLSFFSGMQKWILFQIFDAITWIFLMMFQNFCEIAHEY